MNNENESYCQYVSSRGLMKSCDVYSTMPMSSVKQLLQYDLTKLKDGCSIYVCSSAIPHFQRFIDEIKIKFVLVTGDCDETVPIDIFKSEVDFLSFINHPNIIHWFSQNCFPNHPKLSQIPIGLDYHTLKKNHEWGAQMNPKEQENLLLSIHSNAKPLKNRLCKAYSNFQFTMNTRYGKDRKDAIHKIPSDLVYYEPYKIKRVDTWTKQIEYAFVISPHGNGYDCHRTWEALCLGCIPIVKTSFLDSLFSDLPILIVKDWSDISKELLKETMDQFENKKMNMNKLMLKHWKDMILNACVF
jgi:hypothetical protein